MDINPEDNKPILLKGKTSLQPDDYRNYAAARFVLTKDAKRKVVFGGLQWPHHKEWLRVFTSKFYKKLTANGEVLTRLTFYVVILRGIKYMKEDKIYSQIVVV